MQAPERISIINLYFLLHFLKTGFSPPDSRDFPERINRKNPLKTGSVKLSSYIGSDQELIKLAAAC